MKKNILAILTLSIPLLVVARPSSSEIEMANFRATKSNKKLVVTDAGGSRSIEVKDCNQKIIDQYWDELSKNTKSAGSPQRVRALFAASKKVCKSSKI